VDWLCLLFASYAGNWEPLITNTGIFDTLLPTQIAISDNMFVFIADKRETKILHFDPDGQRLPDIGGRGAGPGYFFTVMDIRVVDNHLFVFELFGRRVHRFDLEGNFASRVRADRMSIWCPPRKVTDGWVYLSPRRGALFHGNDTFSNHHLIAGDVTSDDTSPQFVDSRYSGSIEHDPTRAGISFDQGPDGNIYFFEPGHGFVIKVYDPVKKKVVRILERNIPPVAVTEDWAAETLRARKSAMLSREMGDRLELVDLPSHFPAIMHLSIDWAGHLNIRTGRHWMDHDLPSDLYDLDGQPLGRGRPPAVANRIIAKRGSWIFIRGDRDGELQIWRIPVDELDRFVREISE